MAIDSYAVAYNWLRIAATNIGGTHFSNSLYSPKSKHELSTAVTNAAFIWPAFYIGLDRPMTDNAQAACMWSVMLSKSTKKQET